MASGLATLRKNLIAANLWNDVVVMTYSEFGRRARQNASGGTDHGSAAPQFVMGGGVKGGRVLGEWPGLTKEVLEGPGDLPVKTNYRDVLAPILQRHSPQVDLAKVFPAFELKPQAIHG